MSNAAIKIPGLRYTESGNFLLIAGPCVVESEEIIFNTAEKIKSLSEKYSIPLSSNLHTEKPTGQKVTHSLALVTGRHLKFWLMSGKISISLLLLIFIIQKRQLLLQIM
jgi:hypothetical protein